MVEGLQADHLDMQRYCVQRPDSCVFFSFYFTKVQYIHLEYAKISNASLLQIDEHSQFIHSSGSE